MSALHELIWNYLLGGGGGGGVSVTPLSVSENGTYTAPSGTAYSPVAVNVSGGEWTTNGFADLSEPSGDILISVDVGQYAFYGRPGLGRVEITSQYVYAHAFDTSSAKSIFAPHTSVAPNANDGASAFAGMSQCKTVVVEKLATNFVFSGSSGLEKVDVCGDTSFGGSVFVRCTKLNTLVLRSGTIVANGHSNNFNNTPFASGGAGGTIYIPKSLYDHLGDGTSQDYKAATNWATLDGYGTITWAKIEGSQYENNYVDGTPIS